MSRRIFVFISLVLGAQAVGATDTETLPSGVRTFLVRYLNADSAGAFDQEGRFQKFNIQQDITLESLKDQYPSIKKLTKKLEELDPQLAKSFTFSELEIKANAQVDAQGVALGWGLTDRLTLAGFVPIIQARVELQGEVKEASSTKQVANALSQYNSKNAKQNAEAAVLAQVLRSVPAIKSEHLQNYLVTELGYDPVGTWSARDIGDAELFLKYRVVEGLYYKQAVEMGTVFPTGRVDDPDNLADFEFGHGSWGNYLQTVHDIYLGPLGATLTGVASYRYFWPTTRTERLIPSHDFPLTERKEEMFYHKGSESSLAAIWEQPLFGDFEMELKYEYKWIESDNFRGKDSNYDYGILERFTKEEWEVLGAQLSYSTIQQYRNGEFAIPLKVKLNHEKVVSGLNTELVNYYHMDLQFFF